MKPGAARRAALRGCAAAPATHTELMDRRASQALELMTGFAERTGAAGDRPQRRYLWTDAFAVCNLLALDRREQALELVRRVHEVLAHHRPDDQRTGWLSPEAGPAHPTRGGLRIGKPLPERRPGQPLDERLEWERDGQYFHYLTKWMHALDQVARAARQPLFNQWARELAAAAHRAFVRREGGSLRMVWKMSIDLGRPLVPSMGQHDPLDGYVTCAELDATAHALAGEPPMLDGARSDFAAMTAPGALASADPLGIGGLLFDALRLDRLGGEDDLETALLAAALIGLRAYLPRGDLRAPAHRRLAFRELGLAIGLAAVPRLRRASPPLVEQLAELAPLARAIEDFWLRPEHRAGESWSEHADINEVMLATCLAPDGFLELPMGERDDARVLC